MPLPKDLLRGKRLVVLSNREPYIHEKTRSGITCERAKGGLVSALDPVMQLCGGTWVAWGSTSADFEVGQGNVRVPPENPRYLLKRIQLSESDVEQYYHGFCNRTLWPLFHLFPSKARFDQAEWVSYRRVNHKFAAAVLREIGRNTWVWVHDYHLSLVPAMVRRVVKRARISFFWHIPWVPWESFRNLPWRREILEGILGSDLVGFHTKSYVKNFIDCVVKEFGLRVKDGVIRLDGREVKVAAFSLGIDYDRYAHPSKEVVERAARLRHTLRVKHLILSIDRLDYTKGILKRLEAYERFLEKYPHYRGEVELLLVVTPSRTRVPEYRAMKEEIDKAVGRISGKFHSAHWIPIRYFYRTLSQGELLTFYRTSDVALVTPLMDGLNLISKEYLAAMEDGVLILSEFAGAAEGLKEAILVNPHDLEKVAGAIKDALKMSHEERRRRSRVLRSRVKRFDVYWWLEKFLGEWMKRYA